MRTLLIVIFAILLATPALAQFPPPGIYTCSANGKQIGTLSLLAAGDYDFETGNAGDPGNGTGQIASAGTTVTPQTGPLRDIYDWKGSFTTDATGQTSFQFTGADGLDVTCK